ncbi:outer kinetochore KNL1 complex subunit KNL1 [Pelodytes ibericus]
MAAAGQRNQMLLADVERKASAMLQLASVPSWLVYARSSQICSDLMEHSRWRRISSILKAPRSPLRDLGSGNELNQGTTLQKRRKSSKRVSFAETIRNEDPADTTCNITGMDTLLHAPIQTAAHPKEWDYSSGTRDRTIVFSYENSMDMTASNTVFIDNFPEEKSQKIDVTSFIASLKSQSGDSSKNMECTLPVSTQQPPSFQPATDSSKQPKIKFDDFLASLTTKQVISAPLEGDDKENIFFDTLPSDSNKENPISECGKRFGHSQEDTGGNVTRIFRDNDEDLELTRSHTTNITSLLPLSNKGSLSNDLVRKPLTTPLQDTVRLFGDDMETTYSHTVQIEHPTRNHTPFFGKVPENSGNSKKTIFYTDANEMENDSASVKLIIPEGDFTFQKRKGHTLFSPEEDMDFTQSHTVAIAGSSMPLLTSQSSTASNAMKIKLDPSFDSVKQTSSAANCVEPGHLEMKQLGRPFNQCSDEQTFPIIDGSKYAEATKSVLNSGLSFPQSIISSSQSRRNSGLDKTPEFHVEENSHLSNPLSVTLQMVAKPYLPAALPDRTVLFSCDQDDMDLTKSHTVLINNKVAEEQTISNSSKYHKNEKPKFGGLRLSVPSKRGLFSTDGDLDITKGNMAVIEVKKETLNTKQGALSYDNRQSDKGQSLVCVQDKMQDEMDLTEIGICGFQGEDIFLKENTTIGNTHLKDKTIFFSSEHEDMEITRSHTIAIDAKNMYERNEDNVEGKPKCGSDVASKLCKTVYSSGINSGQEFHQKNTIGTDAKDYRNVMHNSQVWRMQSSTNAGLESTNENGMGLTKSYTGSIEHKIVEQTSHNGILIKRQLPDTLSKVFQDKTILFSSDKNDMDITRSVTVNIETKFLGADTVHDQIGQPLSSGPTGLPPSSRPDQPIISADEKIFRKSHPLYTTDIQCGMDITKSNTVFIDNLLNDTSMRGSKQSTKQRKSMTGPRLMPPTPDKTDYLMGEMEITSANVGLFCEGPSRAEEKNTSIPRTCQDKTLIFSCDVDNMDITKSHTVAIESKVLGEVIQPHHPKMKGALENSFGIHSGPTNETASLEQGMASSRSHIMVESDGVQHLFTRKSIGLTFCGQDDMEMTKSNTVFIDNALAEEETQRELRSLNIVRRKSFARPRTSCVPLDKTVHLVGDMEMTTANVGMLIRHAMGQTEDTTRLSKNFQDKTVMFPSEQNDMDLTQSHTVAIENKILGEVKKQLGNSVTKGNVINRTICSDDKPKNVHSASEDDQQFTKTAIQNNPRGLPNQQVSVNQSIVCSDDMDFTQSNTVFIDNLLGDVSRVTSNPAKRKSMFELERTKANDGLSVSKNREKRDPGAFQNDTLVFSCGTDNMDQTLGGSLQTHIPTIKGTSLNDIDKNGVHVNKTVLLKDDMEFTKSYTVVFDGDNPQGWQDLYPSTKSLSLTICAPDDMEMTKSNTVFIDNVVAEEETMTGFSSQKAAKRKSVPGTQLSGRLHNKTVHLVDDVEMTTTKTRPCVSEEQMLQADEMLISGASHDKTRFFAEPDPMDITRSHTVAIENKITCNLATADNAELKDKVNTTEAGSAPVNNTLFMEDDLELTRSHTVVMDLDNPPDLHHTTPGNKSNIIGPCNMDTVGESIVRLYTGANTSVLKQNKDLNTSNLLQQTVEMEMNELTSQYKMDTTLKVDGELDQEMENLSKMESESTIPPAVLGNTWFDSQASKADCVPLLPQIECVGHILSEGSLPNKNTDDQAAKKARLQSKRVSFRLPETEVDACTFKAQVPYTTAKTVDSTQSSSPLECISHETEREVLLLKTTTERLEPELASADQPSVVYNPNNSSALGNFQEREFNVLHSDATKSVTERRASSAMLASSLELSKKNCDRRRSIADIHFKIKSLTQKSKVIPSSRTSPISCLLEQLPATEQNSGPSSCAKPELLLEAKNSSFIPGTDDLCEPGDAFTAKVETTQKDRCLPNRLSVKVFHPKLPQKRSSRVYPMPEVLTSVSKARSQSDRTSLSLLKTLADSSSAQNIDEEVLPADPDDNEPDGKFGFEVPEGAWEALCETEQRHKAPDQCLSATQETSSGQKRPREQEDEEQIQKEKRAKHIKDITEMNGAKVRSSMVFKIPDEYHTSEYSMLRENKTIEPTNYSSGSSSMDSRGDGISGELTSQQCSQMESQLPWETDCEQSLWQKFQDGTILVKEFFTLLRIRILIQKPRYSELPANLKAKEDQNPEDVLLEQHLHLPKLQVYEEECHALYQTIEELKMCAEIQEKPLIEVNNLLFEAMRMCSEEEVMYFAVKLKRLRAWYAKQSKLLAQKGKVVVYSKLLHTVTAHCEQVRSKMSELDQLLEEVDKTISGLDEETAKLEAECRCGNIADQDPGVRELKTEIENLKSQEENSIKACEQLEDRKQHVLTQIGCLQDDARSLAKRLSENTFSEWELDTWTDDKSVFYFLYDSLELNITFGDIVDSLHFIDQPCRQISSVRLESSMDDDSAPPSSLLVHRLIMQFIEKKGCLQKHYKTQRDLPQLLFELSLVVSRCRLLGEELQYLMKWGAKYNILKMQVHHTEVKLLFSSLAAGAKFELVIKLTEAYPTLPLSFTVVNHIGKIGHSAISAVFSKVPVGPWCLKRTVNELYENLLIPPRGAFLQELGETLVDRLSCDLTGSGYSRLDNDLLKYNCLHPEYFVNELPRVTLDTLDTPEYFVNELPRVTLDTLDTPEYFVDELPRVTLDTLDTNKSYKVDKIAAMAAYRMISCATCVVLQFP